MRKGLLLVAAVLALAALGAFLMSPAVTTRADPIVTSASTEEIEAPAAEPPTAPEPIPSPACVPASVEERAAQTLVVGLPGVVTGTEPLVQELTEIGVGGVLLKRVNVKDADQVRGLIGAMRSASRLPLLVTTDEEPGRVSTFREILGRTSSARTLGATETPDGIQALARQVGQGLASLDVDVDLGTVADLDDGDANGIIGDRSYSADPQVATDAAFAFSQGLLESGVLPTVKHFPGHGRSAVDSHVRFSAVDVTLEELQDTDLAPFQEQIDAGIPIVMLAHVGYSALDPTLPASLDPKAYALLREMGFEGVAMTDSLGMGAVNVTYSYTDAAVRAVTAGADALLATDGTQARAMRDALVAAVADGRLPEARLDEAAARMLVLKGEDPGVLTCTKPAPTAMVASVHARPE